MKPKIRSRDILKFAGFEQTEKISKWIYRNTLGKSDSGTICNFFLSRKNSFLNFQFANDKQELLIQVGIQERLLLLGEQI